MIEQLETRSLMSLSGLPTSVQLAYDALVVDATRLSTAVGGAKKTLAADQKAISADVKALGKSTPNTLLLRQAAAAEAKLVAGLAAAVTRYEIVAKPAYNRTGLAAAYFADFLLPVYAKRLAAAQAALEAVQAKQFNALVTVVTNASVPYTSALAALASANPAAAQLNADVEAAINDQAALSTGEDAIITKIQTDVPTLIDAE